MLGYRPGSNKVVSLTEFGRKGLYSTQETTQYKTKTGGYVSRILKALGELDGTASTNEVSKMTGIRGKDFHNTLDVMEALKLIYSPGRKFL
jgi:hypothetical protein